MSERQKLRARFAMWVLALIGPWLSLWDEALEHTPEELEEMQRAEDQRWRDMEWEIGREAYAEGRQDAERDLRERYDL